MSQAAWDRLEEVFEEARVLPKAARTGFLDRACAGDAGCAREIEAMLAASSPWQHSLSIERFVVDDRLPALAKATPGSANASVPGVSTRVLGEGGMGLVYGAARVDGQYQLEVAVKLMRAGRRDAYAPRAFPHRAPGPRVPEASEHRPLSWMAACAEDGTPYLVMELVEGIPITEWCHTRQLPLERRLSLFRVACDAVQHAHRALVVHRDLKPHEHPGVHATGEVKLLDFGIAKLLEPATWGMRSARRHAPRWRALTPEYAAPEQWHGDADTTATDVYALGVLLYELRDGPSAPGPGRLPQTRARGRADDGDTTERSGPPQRASE